MRDLVNGGWWSGFQGGLVLYHGEEDQCGGAEAEKGEGHWSSRDSIPSSRHLESHMALGRYFMWTVTSIRC